MAGETTMTTLAAWSPETWAAELDYELEARQVLPALFEDVSTQRAPGSTVLNFQVVKDFATGPGSIDEANDTTTAETVAVAENTVTINQFKTKAFKYSGLAQDFSKYEIRNPFTTKLMYALRKQQEQYFAAVAVAATAHTPYVLGDISAATDAEVLAALESVVNDFMDQDIPMPDEGGELAWVMSNALYLRCRRVVQFSSTDYSPRQALTLGGALPTIHGIPVYRSNLLTSTTWSGTSHKNNLLIYKPAVRWAQVGGADILVTDRGGYLNHTWVKAELKYGAASNPDDGTSNYGVHIIRTY